MQTDRQWNTWHPIQLVKRCFRAASRTFPHAWEATALPGRRCFGNALGTWEHTIYWDDFGSKIWEDYHSALPVGAKNDVNKNQKKTNSTQILHHGPVVSCVWVCVCKVDLGRLQQVHSARKTPSGLQLPTLPPFQLHTQTSQEICLWSRKLEFPTKKNTLFWGGVTSHVTHHVRLQRFAFQHSSSLLWWICSTMKSSWAPKTSSLSVRFHAEHDTIPYNSYDSQLQAVWKGIHFSWDNRSLRRSISWGRNPVEHRKKQKKHVWFVCEISIFVFNRCCYRSFSIKK